MKKSFASSANSAFAFLGIRKKPWVRLREQIFFAKRLAFLLSAGIPLIEALTLIRIQTTDAQRASMLDTVIDDVANGRSLSASLERRALYPDLTMIYAIRSGEASGTLGTNLARLADELSRKDALRQRIYASLLYPLFITIATLGICILLVVYIFPKIIPIFESLDATVPISTRMLMGLSSFLSEWGIAVLIALGGLIVAITIAHERSPALRAAADAAMLRIPFIGALARDYQLANITRSMGLMLLSGVPILRALDLAAASATNTSYQAACRAAAERVAAGEALSVSLARFPSLFPLFATHLIEVGERTGKLAESLEYLESFYEGEADIRTKHLSSSIEPALMLAMGLIVGFIAVSIITPIYEITQHVRT